MPVRCETTIIVISMIDRLGPLAIAEQLDVPLRQCFTWAAELHVKSGGRTASLSQHCTLTVYIDCSAQDYMGVVAL